LNASMTYHMDFSKSVMGTSAGDIPITLTPESVAWRYSGKAPNGTSDVTEEGTISRPSGVLLVRRQVTRPNGEVDVSEITGQCRGLK